MKAKPAIAIHQPEQARELALAMAALNHHPENEVVHVRDTQLGHTGYLSYRFPEDPRHIAVVVYDKDPVSVVYTLEREGRFVPIELEEVE